MSPGPLALCGPRSLREPPLQPLLCATMHEASLPSTMPLTFSMPLLGWWVSHSPTIA